MSVSSLWDNLSDLFTSGLLLVDFLRSALLWLCLVLAPVYFVALAAWVLDRLANESSNPGDTTSCHQPGSFYDRLDQMVNIAVSRRPQTRKRRHHHHAH